MTGGEVRVFYLNFLYCESGFCISLLLVNWKRLILFNKLLKTYQLKLDIDFILKLGRREQRQKIIKNLLNYCKSIWSLVIKQQQQQQQQKTDYFIT